ncbi:uncharacterized protein LOC133180592 [Saccostrea echinata]|uniref:uncharacterized protein LOC133180592 n=1 Tax=Saccostrea echinata TaxID=191078 RepID=UPI002A7FE262|nr:uncharacterized protein LOC133180592 [Saccostrea echinata]
MDFSDSDRASDEDRETACMLDTESDSEDFVSDEEECHQSVPSKRKRGRPFGSYQRGETEDEDSGDDLSPVQANEEDLISFRENFQAMSSLERRQWLLDYLWSHSQFDEQSQSWGFIFILGTTSVCCAAFRAVLGIPQSTFYEVRSLFLKNQKSVTSYKRKGRQTKSMKAIAWLKLYAQNYGEKLPNSHHIHLPPCSTKLHVYELMVEESQGDFMSPVSLSHFLSLWRSEASYIAIPKNNRFSKCNVCTEIKIKLGETRDAQERMMLQKKRDNHLKKQNIERQKYYKHQQKAKMFPNKYLSLIIDGMDQSKTSLPHFVHASKFTSTMWKLRVHLIGVIVHGIGIYGFFDLFQYSHSTNLTISILLSVLYSMKDSLPDTLYIQMDNCARENKNRYLLGFMCYLVEIGLFRKIKISFLMVGHTHEDIDQVFSKFSHWLGRHAAMTLMKLMNGFEACYTPGPHSIKTNRVYNITEWITPFLNTIKNHSKPHVFKILQDETGKAKLYWKKWSTDKEWTDSSNYLLKENVVGSPLVIEPDYSEIEENRERLESDVRGSYRFFGKEDDKRWWENFFSSQFDDTEDALQMSQGTEPLEPTDVYNFDLEEDSEIPPVIIGKCAPSAKATDIAPGDFVCADVPKYAGEWPQLGRIVSVECDSVQLQWYKGSRTTAWTPCTRRVKGVRGKTEPWMEKR